jgi:flagellar biosynthesis protein FliQ
LWYGTRDELPPGLRNYVDGWTGAMTLDDIVDIGQRAMWVTLLASAPMLLSGMVVGLTISIFQSVTQIQEITLTFVPKIVVVMVMFVLFLPWMSDTILTFVRGLYGNFDTLVLPR